MKRLMMVLGLLVSMAVVSLPAHATGHYQSNGWFCSAFPSVCSKVKYKFKKHKNKKVKKKFYTGSKPKHHSVPEIDAAGAAISLALAAGVVSIMRERRKKA